MTLKEMGLSVQPLKNTYRIENNLWTNNKENRRTNSPERTNHSYKHTQQTEYLISIFVHTDM